MITNYHTPSERYDHDYFQFNSWSWFDISFLLFSFSRKTKQCAKNIQKPLDLAGILPILVQYCCFLKCFCQCYCWLIVLSQTWLQYNSQPHTFPPSACGTNREDYCTSEQVPVLLLTKARALLFWEQFILDLILIKQCYGLFVQPVWRDRVPARSWDLQKASEAASVAAH